MRPKTRFMRKLAEGGAFALLIALLWGLDTLTKRRLILGGGYDFELFRLYTEQATSAVVVLALVPAVAWWLDRFPIERARWLSAAVGHTIGTGLFAVIHYFGMIGLRYLVFALVGRTYTFSDFWLNNLLIEYQKDIKIYLAIVAIVAVYRRLRASGDARKKNTAGTGRRLVVQTGTGQSVIRHDQIEALEAARNYVTIHTPDREYLVRQTLKSLEESLDSNVILRCHRSYLVNVDCIEEIRSTESGNHVIRMTSGREVPLSRGFRDAFRSRLMT